MSDVNVLHYFSSKSQAQAISAIVSRQAGNGGKKCFLVDECPISSFPSRRVYRIRFLADEYEKAFRLEVPMRLAATTIHEHVRSMRGFILGYLYATTQASKREKTLNCHRLAGSE